MRKKLFIGLGLLLTLTLIFAIRVVSQQATPSHKDKVSGPFNTPQDVTKTCLTCHPAVADEFMKTRHWKWTGDEFEKNGKKMVFGKKNSINNFCVALSSNEPRCTSCHPGYGWKDGTFDFTIKENIDCLVCHDQTGTYEKSPTGAGMPDPKVNLLEVAQSVGKSTIKNCGTCHFYGGGGAAVKHGDLDPSLYKATKDLDVHIGGQGFNCTKCHKTEKHQISGAGHGSAIQGINQIHCTDCHNKAEGVHSNKIINKHTAAIACQTCHIPTFAREMATKTFWDWSTAGQKEDVKGEDGNHTYSKMKGDFVWEKNVKPVYRWSNGTADYYLAGDKIESTPLQLNKLNGTISDANAKIYPYKLMKGKQIYDKKNNYLIIPKLFGPDGYWKTYDWNKASELGMKSVNLAYSGEFGFVETDMYWQINHMVAPKGNALKCNDCHTSGTRLDWAALGYAGDPMKKGGRVKNGLIK